MPIGAQSINPVPISSGELQDKAVTTAKLADGTQGDILYFGAAGVAALLGAGSAGEALISGGAAANPAWGNAGNIKMVAGTHAAEVTHTGDTILTKKVIIPLSPTDANSVLLGVWVQYEQKTSNGGNECAIHFGMNGTNAGLWQPQSKGDSNADIKIDASSQKGMNLSTGAWENNETKTLGDNTKIGSTLNTSYEEKRNMMFVPLLTGDASYNIDFWMAIDAAGETAYIREMKVYLLYFDP